MLILAAAVFFILLVTASWIDLRAGIVPDRLTFPGMAIGFLCSAIYPPLQLVSGRWVSAGMSLSGIFVGAGLIFITAIFGRYLFKRETIGGGDAKLLAMIGSFLGWKRVLLAYFLAPFLTLPFALYFRWAKKQDTLPYGPFISLSGAIQFFWGSQLWALLFH